MNTKIKAVFFDVDSTIYAHNQHDVPPSTKIALNRLKMNEIKVGIATSRCRFEMKNTPELFREYPFSGMIFDGGALVMEKDTVLSQQFVNKEDVKKVIDFARRNELTVRYSTFEKDYFASKPKQEDKDIFFKLYLNTPIVKAYEDEEVLNILVYVKDDALYKEIHEMLPGTTIVDHGRVLEINSGKIDKSEGIEVLCKHWNISMDEVMCFGDGENDVNMIKQAGIGVAMGNGCDAVKAVADYVSESIHNDGVFIALRKFDLI